MCTFNGIGVQYHPLDQLLYLEYMISSCLFLNPPSVAKLISSRENHMHQGLYFVQVKIFKHKQANPPIFAAEARQLPNPSRQQRSRTRGVIRFEYRHWCSQQNREPCSISTGPHLLLTCCGRQQPQLSVKPEPRQDFMVGQFTFLAGQFTFFPISTPQGTPQTPREYWHQDLVNTCTAFSLEAKKFENKLPNNGCSMH
jgi:hypothetical protein